MAVVLGADAPRPHGTSVRFDADEDREAIRRAIENSARHYPLPVTLDGEAISRRAFLDGAVHAESWQGLAFGVLTGRSRYRDEPDLNFHGLILPVRLPTVHPVDGPAFSVRADVGNCPELELVLPARKEAVETPFFDEMREAARVAIYRAMAAADSAPAIAFEDWRRARAAGVELPVPAPALRPWRPPVADTDNWLAGPAPKSLPTGALVDRCGPGTPRSPGALARRRTRRNGSAALRGRSPVRRLRLVRHAPPRQQCPDPRSWANGKMPVRSGTTKPCPRGPARPIEPASEAGRNPREARCPIPGRDE